MSCTFFPGDFTDPYFQYFSVAFLLGQHDYYLRDIKSISQIEPNPIRHSTNQRSSVESF